LSEVYRIPVGVTCRMGRAVGNTNLPVIMAAEKCADAIKQP